MSFLINHNTFSLDDDGIRMTRLEFLQRSISDYASELSISDTMLDWALNSGDIFTKALTSKDLQKGSMMEAVQTYQENFQELKEKYQIYKNIIKSRYADNPEKLVIFGVQQRTDVTMDGIKRSAELLIQGNNKLKELSDPNVLPDSMIDNLQNILDQINENYLKASLEKEEYQNKLKEYRKIFDEDTKKLRALYNWVIAFWGAENPKLIPLGFDIKRKRRRKKADEDENVEPTPIDDGENR